MHTRARINARTLELVSGDITRQEVDAVVNAANQGLAGGGGVDGAIHRAGGPSIMRETSEKYPEGCPPGSAVLTGAGDLPARFVIHAVGPIWQGGDQGEPALLAAAHRRCLELAFEAHCRSIAFPAISTGVYGYPVRLAAETALAEVSQFLASPSLTARPDLLQLVRFVLFSDDALCQFSEALGDLGESA